MLIYVSFDIGFEATDVVQVNGAVNRLMLERKIALLEIDESHRALDLYRGIGNFSLPLARCAEFVLGTVGEAHQEWRGRANAQRNGIDSCEFLQPDLSAIEVNDSWLKQHWD